jgi:hypothetical protein
VVAWMWCVHAAVSALSEKKCFFPMPLRSMSCIVILHAAHWAAHDSKLYRWKLCSFQNWYGPLGCKLLNSLLQFKYLRPIGPHMFNTVYHAWSKYIWYLPFSDHWNANGLTLKCSQMQFHETRYQVNQGFNHVVSDKRLHEPHKHLKLEHCLVLLLREQKDLTTKAQCIQKQTYIVCICVFFLHTKTHTYIHTYIDIYIYKYYPCNISMFSRDHFYYVSFLNTF